MDLCPGSGDENQAVANFWPECGVALLDYSATRHEDDPKRAVRAAVGVRGWVVGHEVGQQLRIAVITGEALVALESRANQGEGMASGNVVNTTRRWKTGAQVKGPLIGEAIYRATAPVITYRDAEPMAARGKASAAGSARTIRLAHS
jgi:hypothetical protein